MQLSDILYKVKIRSVVGGTELDIKDVQIDSRKITQGSLFIAVRGTAIDGHQFIAKAIKQGAVAIVHEQTSVEKKEGVTLVQVENTATAAGIIAHNFYNQPSAKMKVVGVTGTNGKTTIATLLYKLFTSLGYKSGLISTIENNIGNKTVAATHTTPDAVSLNALLKQMVDEGCTHVFMEESSHAIHQHRMTGLRFAGGIFTK